MFERVKRICWLSLLCAAACGDDGSVTRPDGGGGDVTAPTPFDRQVELGVDLYTDNCARCHGGDGTGTGLAPPLVGLDDGALPIEPRPGSMRTTRFETVGDVAGFAAAAMPADAPGSLTVDEYYAILAFDLFANGIVLEQELTPAIAESLTIPR